MPNDTHKLSGVRARAALSTSMRCRHARQTVDRLLLGIEAFKLHGGETYHAGPGLD